VGGLAPDSFISIPQLQNGEYGGLRLRVNPPRKPSSTTHHASLLARNICVGNLRASKRQRFATLVHNESSVRGPS